MSDQVPEEQPHFSTPALSYTPSTKPPSSRWGFRGTVYFYDHGGEPTEAIQIAYNHACEQDELPWKSSRKLVATPEWQPLPVGWPDSDFQAGLVVVTNKEGGPSPGGIPTDEIKAEIAAKVVMLAVEDEGSPGVLTAWAEVAPGRSQPFTPVAGITYHFRSLSGNAAVSVVALPH